MASSFLRNVSSEWVMDFISRWVARRFLASLCLRRCFGIQVCGGLCGNLFGWLSYWKLISLSVVLKLQIMSLAFKFILQYGQPLPWSTHNAYCKALMGCLLLAWICGAKYLYYLHLMKWQVAPKTCKELYNTSLCSLRINCVEPVRLNLTRFDWVNHLIRSPNEWFSKLGLT
jgi:hypothetical protein